MSPSVDLQKAGDRLPLPSKTDNNIFDVPGSVFFVSSNGQVLKLPIPSTSERDPLAWSWGKRIAAFTALQFYSVVACLEINLPGVLMGALCDEFSTEDMKPFTPKTLSSAMTLFTGLGYLVSIPISTAVGRRPIFVTSAVVTALSTIWAGFSGNYYELLAAVCFQALAVGTAIGMSVLITMDATFIHERPYALSMYWCFGSAIIKSIFIILPQIEDLNSHWRDVYKVWSIPCTVAIFLLIIFLPETYFFRPPIALDGRMLGQSSSEHVRLYDGWKLFQGPQRQKDLPQKPRLASLLERLKVSRAPGTYARSAVATYMQMLLCIINPLVFWVAILAGAILSGVIFLNMVQPLILAQPPYNQNAEVTSINIGICGIVGSLIAFPATGPLIAWFTRCCSLRCGGIRHAESYLPGFAVPVLTSLISLGINFAAIKSVLPSTYFYISSALSIMSYVTGNVAFTLWITEAFPRWAAATFAVQVFIGNMFSFGLGFSFLPLIENNEIGIPTGLLMGIVAALGIIVVPVAFWGKQVRQLIHGRWSFSERAALRPQ